MTGEPVYIGPLPTCRFCGYPRVLNWWPYEGFRADHRLPKDRFPTLEDAARFMEGHP